jgi:hypothetical protein
MPHSISRPTLVHRQQRGTLLHSLQWRRRKEAVPVKTQRKTLPVASVSALDVHEVCASSYSSFLIMLQQVLQLRFLNSPHRNFLK